MNVQRRETCLLWERKSRADAKITKNKSSSLELSDGLKYSVELKLNPIGCADLTLVRFQCARTARCGWCHFDSLLFELLLSIGDPVEKRFAFMRRYEVDRCGRLLFIFPFRFAVQLLFRFQKSVQCSPTRTACAKHIVFWRAFFEELQMIVISFAVMCNVDQIEMERL